MYESLGFENLTAPQAAVYLALGLGLLFGALAERTRFCFRRALVGEDRRAASGVWFMALATALIGTQAAVAAGWISFAEHRFMAPDLPWLAIVAGGLAFGAGMVLTRGCVSRLTVLSATGNLRALTVLAIFAITAHALLKGVASPIRTALGSVTVDLGATAGFASLPGGAWLWTAALTGLALLVVARSKASPSMLVGAALLGLLVPAAWIGTGFILYDDFDPVVMQSLAFTSTWSETLFWVIASTAVPAGFGVGLIIGVLAGSFLSAAATRRLQWQSFSSPRETGRYLTGAVLMGFGGVLAGGCTVGAGLSGVPTLSFAAMLALGSIAAGGLVTNALLKATPRSTHALAPAE
ncbi:YeeE/YedE family protein [Sagittula stellata]|uniref:YeeE/YedE family protein n=1 Tax=Sagittula stellata (strain ATCC 700073 / DSM 11524 / E-37) TaxID=388399 RepID=A3KA22_SAGS3|nr:YeeE/YedE family protein [Sagittula stellata]EBA05965.1 YeeE/YedE family protein [Sagittula stellata E-37]